MYGDTIAWNLLHEIYCMNILHGSKSHLRNSESKYENALSIVDLHSKFRSPLVSSFFCKKKMVHTLIEWVLKLGLMCKFEQKTTTTFFACFLKEQFNEIVNFFLSLKKVHQQCWFKPRTFLMLINFFYLFLKFFFY